MFHLLFTSCSTVFRTTRSKALEPLSLHSDGCPTHTLLPTSGSCCAACAQKGSATFLLEELTGCDHLTSRCVCDPVVGGAISVDACSAMTAPEHVVLCVSTGHTGTKTLSNNGKQIEGNSNTCYEKVSPIDIVWNFEAHNIYGDTRDLVAHAGLKRWYMGLAGMNATEQEAEAMELVRTRILPDMLATARTQLGSAQAVRTSTYVDMGHHVRPLALQLLPPSRDHPNTIGTKPSRIPLHPLPATPLWPSHQAHPPPSLSITSLFRSPPPLPACPKTPSLPQNASPAHAPTVRLAPTLRPHLPPTLAHTHCPHTLIDSLIDSTN